MNERMDTNPSKVSAFSSWAKTCLSQAALLSHETSSKYMSTWLWKDVYRQHLYLLPMRLKSVEG